MAEQLDMFGGPPPRGVRPAAQAPRVLELATRLRSDLRLGTSSWTFPGWKGLVYDGEVGTKSLVKDGLAAYARHPLFRTVGVDRTYYAPVAVPVLKAYADVVPDDFRFLVKAHSGVTQARFGLDPRYGERAGQGNTNFLEVGYATDAVVGPFLEGLGPKAGVLLFQFPPQSLAVVGGPRGFPDRLHRFLSALPKPTGEAVYAVEVRNPELMTTHYYAALRDVGVEACLNALPNMPALPVQYAMSGGRERRALVVRWMLHRTHDYAGAKAAFAPFDRIVLEDEGTRADLARIIAPVGVPTYVIVNNKAEGSSPQSILALVERLVAGA